MLKPSNSLEKKPLKRKAAENSVLPCPCQVGIGRASSFQMVTENMNDYCRRINLKLKVKDVGVASKEDENADHANGTVWIMDIQGVDGGFSSKEALLKAVKDVITPLKGIIDTVSREKVRVVLPVPKKSCQDEPLMKKVKHLQHD